MAIPVISHGDRGVTQDFLNPLWGPGEVGDEQARGRVPKAVEPIASLPLFVDKTALDLKRVPHATLNVRQAFDVSETPLAEPRQHDFMLTSWSSSGRLPPGRAESTTSTTRNEILRQRSQALPPARLIFGNAKVGELWSRSSLPLELHDVSMQRRLARVHAVADPESFPNDSGVAPPRAARISRRFRPTVLIPAHFSGGRICLPRSWATSMTW